MEPDPGQCRPQDLVAAAGVGLEDGRSRLRLPPGLQRLEQSPGGDDLSEAVAPGVQLETPMTTRISSTLTRTRRRSFPVSAMAEVPPRGEWSE